MWLLLLFFLGAAPTWAEDLGELSANPAGLSGSFGFFGFPISRSIERDKPDKPVLVSPNQTDQINQTNEMNQFRLSLRPRPAN
ncbi:MAG: hypothetical protein AAB177_08710 [Nitrospirota bacterium]|jgi:hypothetical protein